MKSVLVVNEDSVTVDARAVEIDVVRFEALVATRGLPALAEAAELFRGDFLAALAVAEPPFEEWLLTERERLRELAMEAMAFLLAHQSSADDPGPAAQTARKLLALDPLQEAAHRTLMTLYARQGRKAGAAGR